MKRSIVLVSLCVFLVTGCRGAGSRLSDLERSNEDLTKRVKALEDQLLETDKKQIRQEDLIRQMYQRVKEMENTVNRFQMGPAR